MGKEKRRKGRERKRTDDTLSKISELMMSR